MQGQRQGDDLEWLRIGRTREEQQIHPHRVAAVNAEVGARRDCSSRQAGPVYRPKKCNYSALKICNQS